MALITSKTVFLSIHVILALFLQVLGSDQGNGSKCLEREKQALLEFKAELIDDHDRLSTWGDDNCCRWKGIRCDNHTNHAVALDLRAPFVDNSSLYAPLRGNIHSSLLELVDLSYLDLSGNNFSTIEIPKHIGSIRKLQYLNLSNSQFVGSIPSHIGNLSALRVLDLSSNWINAGTDLGWMGGLHSLRSLDLSIVDLGEAKTWIHTINKLTTLERLYLRQCGIKEVPSSSFPQPNASYSISAVDLSLNNFNSTSILLWFLKLRNVFSYIDFSWNGIHGKIPDDFTSLISLSHLDLSGNNLEGTIPDGFRNLISLAYLDLSRNNLTGGIPRALEHMVSLVYLDLSRNSYLGGRIPDGLGKFSSLTYLDLSFNNLQGGFPESHGHLTNLVSLSLNDNQLEGELTHMTKFLWNSSMLEYLHLGGNLFYGSLPPLSRFPLLKVVGFSNNQFNGTFGEIRLNLPYLTILDVSGNRLTGSLPDFSPCSSLLSLSLNDNLFNGILTHSIANLSQLDSLIVHHNSLEGVVSETHLLNLLKLQNLDMSFNPNLTLSISPKWNPPFQLTFIKLASCKLGPKFPEWLQKHRQVTHLDISNSDISDTVPNWFWENIHTVYDLNMSYNKISGDIPDLSLNSNLSFWLDLRSNEFNGSLPFLPPNLGTIDLSRNKFSGGIDHFCNTTATVLDLSYNLLSGELSDDCFENLMNMQRLNLASNNFSGHIPSLNYSRCILSSLHLRNNSFEGEIGTSLKFCNQLTILDLGMNIFSGKIPDWIGESLPALGILSLRSNELYGTIPSTLCQVQSLQILDLSMNKLNGTIPRCLNNFTVMRTRPDSDDEESVYRFLFASRVVTSFYDSAYLVWKGQGATYDKLLGLLKVIDLSSNTLVGEIPPEIVDLEGLIALNLSRNNLVGRIPHGINGLEFLNFLDLSQNNLSGEIPTSLSQLSHLGVLNLSFNNLSGKVPWSGQLQTFDGDAYVGNPGLCGPPLPKPCPEDVNVMPEPRNGNEGQDSIGDKSIITKEFYISMGLGFVLAIGGVFWASFIRRFKIWVCLEDWLYKKVARSS